MSQRVLIVGVSESGKSALADSFIKKSPFPVYIRDPVGAHWSKCNGRFNTSAGLRLLMDKQKVKTPCVALIDEGADFFTTGQKENHWIMTRGRHGAILPIVICHYVKAMAPIVRDQASDLFVFESSKDAGEILADSYNMPALKDAHKLHQGEFYHVRRVDKVRIITKHKLF